MVYPRNALITDRQANGTLTPSATLLDRSVPEILAAERPAQSTITLGPASATSEQLARQTQAGCVESFEQLVLRFEKQIFNFLRQLTRNQQDAEDLTQETFLKAYRNLHRYQPSLAFAPWLFVIARRTAANHFRAVEHFEELQADGESGEENPATVLEHKDECKWLWKLVRRLKPKQTEAIWLRYAEGFSVAETARIMQTNQIHVKVLLHRARSNLSKMLAARGDRPSAVPAAER